MFAYADRSDRGRLRLTGRDRQSFLQGMVTNDVAALVPGTGCYAFQLDPTGHVLADLRVLCTDDALWIDTEPGVAAEVAVRLEGYLIMERCRIEDVTDETAQILIVGDAAPAALRTFGWEDADQAREGDNRRLSGDTFSFIGARSVLLPEPAFDLIVALANKPALEASLVAAGVDVLPAGALETGRVEAGVPRFGVDIDPKVLAPETGQADRAIHYRKGCYIGQEIVARIDARGHTNRSLTGFRLAAPVAPGTEVSVDGKAVGRITSCVVSDRVGGAIALGYLRNAHREPGTAVAVGETTGVVAELPFVGARP